MRGSLFAIFRGSDGRSLAWALAILLIVNAFAAGANIGFAAATPGQVLCAIGDTHSGDAPAMPGHADPCCLAGCVISAARVDAAETILPMPHSAAATSVLPIDATAWALPRLPGHGPRGPPLLA